jgi:hypothetical protein
VEGDLLAWRGECPRHLEPAFLPKDEAQLTGRPQPVRVRRAERSTRARVGHCAEKVLTKEAILTARLRGVRPTVRHTVLDPMSLTLNYKQAGIKADSTAQRKAHFRKSQQIHLWGKTSKVRGFSAAVRSSPHFP